MSGNISAFKSEHEFGPFFFLREAAGLCCGTLMISNNSYIVYETV
jgi:hypothetical protein